MGSEIKKLPKSKIEIKIELSGEEFSPYLILGARELSKELDFPGFRPGKVPFKIVKERVGLPRILERAAKIALNKIFPEIARENNLEILGGSEAKIEKLSEEEFKVKIEAAIFPEIKLPLWRQIVKKEPRKKIKVEEEEVEKSLKYLQKSRAKFSRKSGSAEKGDLILIDYEIKSGGVKIENGDIRGQKFILGEGKLIPGFEENLIGIKENEERLFSLIAPSDFWKRSLQGKPLEFRVKMKGVFKVELPQIDDEWVQSLGKFKSLESLKQSILKGIKMEKEGEERKRWGRTVLEKISNEAEMDLPDILVKSERDQMIRDLQRSVEEMGLSFDIYLSHLKKSLEDLKRNFLPEAEKRVRIFLSIYRIAKEENIKIAEEEVIEEINEILKKFPHLISEFKGQNREKIKSYLKDNILQKKVLKLLSSEAGQE